MFSRAVTQGASGLIVDALKRAGHGRWFSVVERTGLNDLLQERQLVRATRQEFDKDNAKPLPPIRFAGLIVEGGILTYDANTMTGGLGANFLGIGANSQYRRDMVTVGVRIVSVQSGEVLTSVTTTKTVYSAGISANVYKFVSTDKILQVEGGFTRNEPTQLAVRQAIDLAVYATVMEGARAGILEVRGSLRGTAADSPHLCGTRQGDGAGLGRRGRLRARADRASSFTVAGRFPHETRRGPRAAFRASGAPA